MLVERDIQVDYAIHPVAGRMPGHMNVLLAEAQVPYEQLKEMDDINGDFKDADVVLVVGANDVVNPAAKTTPGAPIYGMPILNADEGKQVIFMKRSMRPGFAGIENELLFDERTTLLFGDAKDTMGKLLSAVKALWADHGSSPVKRPRPTWATDRVDTRGRVSGRAWQARAGEPRRRAAAGTGSPSCWSCSSPRPSALLLTVDTESRVPAAWPAAGLLTGLLVVVDRARRATMIALAGGLLVLAHLLAGYDALSAVGFALACVAGTWVTLRRLHRGLGGRRVGLVEEGDVSRLIAAASHGATVAAVAVAAVVAVSGAGSPWLALVAVWGTHAAAQLMLVPLFLEGPPFAPLAPVRERIVQSVLTLGVTVLIFSYAAAPPLVFAVMPMFAWLAFRGTLREASLLLTASAWSPRPDHAGVRSGPRAHRPLLPRTRAGHRLPPALPARLRPDPAAALGDDHAAADVRGPRHLPTADAATAGRRRDRVGRHRDRPRRPDQGLQPRRRGGAGPCRRGRPRPARRPAVLRRGAPPAGRAPRTRPIFADICAATVAADDERQLWHFRRPDGEQRTMLLAVTGIQDELGEPSGYLCVAEDVTERESAHGSLVTALDHERDAVERLRELERVKADFVATVSHELRTPLTSMIGYVELLEDGEVGELSADQRAVANRVQRNGRRLLLLVEDLLLLSQIEARQMKLTRPGATCATPPGRRTTPSARCSRPGTSRWCCGCPTSRSCTRATRSRSSGCCSTCSATR